MELERREIKPTMVYYRSIIEPLRLDAASDGLTTVNTPTSKMEKWVCVSKPLDERSIALFLLEDIE